MGEAELGRRTGQADGADEQAEPALLGGEHVLDPDPDPRRAALLRAMCAGMGRLRGFARWNWGTRPRRAKSATLAAER